MPQRVPPVATLPPKLPQPPCSTWPARSVALLQEMLACYALIEKKGRGVVYYGSARLKQDSPHWDRAVELGREVANLLSCTTWSGGGPGMMEAATLGALRWGGREAAARQRCPMRRTRWGCCAAHAMPLLRCLCEAGACLPAAVLASPWAASASR